MNVTQTEYDRIARQHGAQYAFHAYTYSLVYQWADQQHTHVLFFSQPDERQRFADNVRALGGRVVGASHGNTQGLA